MRKNSHGRILKREPKEQHLSTIPKFCPFLEKGKQISYTIFRYF